jgi:hypothetical protein
MHMHVTQKQRGEPQARAIVPPAARSLLRRPLAHGALTDAEIDAEIGRDSGCWLLVLGPCGMRRYAPILVQVHPGLRLGR